MYLRTFEPTSEEEQLNGNQTAVQVDGIFLFCNAQIKSGNNDVRFCIIYYMSVRPYGLLFESSLS